MKILQLLRVMDLERKDKVLTNLSCENPFTIIDIKRCTDNDIRLIDQSGVSHKLDPWRFVLLMHRPHKRKQTRK